MERRCDDSDQYAKLKVMGFCELRELVYEDIKNFVPLDFKYTTATKFTTLAAMLSASADVDMVPANFTNTFLAMLDTALRVLLPKQTASVLHPRTIERVTTVTQRTCDVDSLLDLLDNLELAGTVCGSSLFRNEWNTEQNKSRRVEVTTQELINATPAIKRLKERLLEARNGECTICCMPYAASESPTNGTLQILGTCCGFTLCSRCKKRCRTCPNCRATLPTRLAAIAVRGASGPM